MDATVYVVMGNDYPDAVFSNEADAAVYIAEKKKDVSAQRFGHAKIYWRFYKFKVQ